MGFFQFKELSILWADNLRDHMGHMVVVGFIRRCSSTEPFVDDSCSDVEWKSSGSTRHRTEIDTKYLFNVRLDSPVFILRFRRGNLQQVTLITVLTSGNCIDIPQIFEPSGLDSRSTILHTDFFHPQSQSSTGNLSTSIQI